MPMLANHATKVDGSLGTLHDELTRLLVKLGPSALVMTEVGLNQGRDVFIAGCAMSIRDECGRVVISADEKP